MECIEAAVAAIKTPTIHTVSAHTDVRPRPTPLAAAAATVAATIATTTMESCATQPARATLICGRAVTQVIATAIAITHISMETWPAAAGQPTSATRTKQHTTQRTQALLQVSVSPSLHSPSSPVICDQSLRAGTALPRSMAQGALPRPIHTHIHIHILLQLTWAQAQAQAQAQPLPL